MKSSGRRGVHAALPQRDVQAVIPLRPAKSGEGAASAMEQLRLQEQARLQQQRQPPEAQRPG